MILETVNGSSNMMPSETNHTLNHHMEVSKMEVPQNGWFIMENPMKIDDLWYPHFRKPLHVTTMSIFYMGHENQV